MLARVLLACAFLLALAPSALAATPDIHAHRGGKVVNGTPLFAEESIRAYKHAARHGFVLEVDAKLTEDGVPVALHDATLDRTTNCSGELRTFTLVELSGCRTDVLGSPGSPLPTRSAGRTVAIATIAEVLEFARRAGAKVNLEIKNVPTDPDFDSTRAYANRVMDVVLASRIPRAQLLIQSFVPLNLAVARTRMPRVATSLLSIQALNEPFLPVAADNGYDFISPEWPVSADYVRRAHGLGRDVAPFTLDTAADVRAADAAKVDALITDDPLMAARALGLRPLKRFDAFAFIDGRRLFALGHMRLPAGVSARRGCRGRVTMRVMNRDGRLLKTVRGRVLAGCEFRFSTGRTPARIGAPLVTIRFGGNTVLVPRLDGPERAALRPPNLQPERRRHGGGTLRRAVHVQVRLGAGLATAAGTRRLSVTLPDGATVDMLLDRLGELEPGIATGLTSALPVVRGTHASHEQELSDGDEVALLIPVAGGSAGSAHPKRRQPWQ